MKATGRDLVKLRRPLLGALASIVLAGGLIVWSNDKLRGAQLEHDGEQARRKLVEQRLQQADGEARDLSSRAGIFRRLQESGVIGEESRLEWVEMLQAIRRDLHLPDLHYEFSGQTPLDNANRSGHAYFSSRLQLQLRQVHEEDLLKVLTRIEREARALVLLHSCHLGRSPGTEEFSLLQAECEMSWITIQLARASK